MNERNKQLLNNYEWEHILHDYTIHDIAKAVDNMSDEQFIEFFRELYSLSNKKEAENSCEISHWIDECLNEIETKEEEILSFHDDREKMIDFLELSKEEFLTSYSYLTEEEYKATKHTILRKLSEMKNS